MLEKLRGPRAWLTVVSTAAAAVVLVVSVIPHEAAPAAAPVQAQNVARVGGRPDFNGIWQANNTANWDLQTHAARPLVAQAGYNPNTVTLASSVLGLGTLGWVPAGMGVVDGDTIPYQPWAAARQQENLANWMDRDPEIKCFQPGIPRAMYMPYPFQIVQGDNKINMVFEFANAQRTIHLNKMDPYPNVSWMGHSEGRWEGDTLIVNSTDFTDATWFDRSGNFHSDALKVTERFSPMSRDIIRYEATIEDPQVFTKPWKIGMPLYRRVEAGAQLMDFRCVTMVEETLYGHLRKEQFIKPFVGKTMTVTVTRTIPPGEEVHERYISGNPPNN
jgi:hypothetical protein